MKDQTMFESQSARGILNTFGLKNLMFWHIWALKMDGLYYTAFTLYNMISSVKDKWRFAGINMMNLTELYFPSVN